VLLFELRADWPLIFYSGFFRARTGSEKEPGKLIAFEFGRKTTKVVIGKKKMAG
jgi:hypothetical protein